MVIDLPSDKGLAHFHSISRILDLPEFVKEAEFTEQAETNKLPRDSFADSLDRLFPIHTKAAAYLSYAYFVKQRDTMDKQASFRCSEGFEKAKGYWGLHEDFEVIERELTKEAEVVEGKFAMTLEDDQFFPINTPYEIMKSAEALTSNRHRFDYGLRSQGAKNIMKAAAESGLPLSVLPEGIHKMAGNGITTKEAAMLELTRRWDSEKRPSLSAPLHTCIEALGNIDSGLIGGEVCEKIASILDEYDRAAGNPSFPEDVLFAFTKHAATKLADSVVTMIDGTSYALHQLEKAAEAFGVLGELVVRDIKNLDGSLNLSKVAELLDTLPRTDASMLKEALTTFGVEPCTLDKHAMVHLAVKEVQPATLTTTHRKTEKRASILSRMEAEDPIVKRALSVVRLLKEAEAEEKADTDESEDESDKRKDGDHPRDHGGRFMKKAPNSVELSAAN